MGSRHFDGVAAQWDEDPRKIERARAVADGIRTQVPLSSETALLEYGAGTGLLSFELAEEVGPITLADSSEGMLEVAGRKVADAGRANTEVIELDLERDPPPERRYDLVVTMMTLHHIMAIDAVLAAFRNLLRTGGTLAIADLDKEDGTFHPAGMNVHHGFERAELERRLRQTGFTDVRFDDCFTVERDNGHYPMFLAVATRP